MNNKGFMMAEVIVVASIVMIALVGLYTSYNKIFTIYNQRVDYYDVATLYELSDIRRDVYYSDENYNSKDKVYDKDYKTVYLVNKNDLDSLVTVVEHQMFKDYLEFISGSVTFETEQILVMERCINSDINNCKYAYLEMLYEEA